MTDEQRSRWPGAAPPRRARTLCLAGVVARSSQITRIGSSLAPSQPAKSPRAESEFIFEQTLSPRCGAKPKTPAISIPSAADIIARLRRGHPRLLANAKDFARLKDRIPGDPQLRTWYTRLEAQAQTLLKVPPSRYVIPDGLRLLATSRRVLARVYTLALLYRLDGNRRYAERAWHELDTAAHFKDWNPRHFLDTAEMTHAFAIGYDWLYDCWTPAQRTELRAAIVEKGLNPANDIQNRHTWWATAHHNWNQVCNGGIGMGALAIGDEAPGPAGQFLQAALRSIQLPMAEFAPDGAWPEGPAYWNYATFYNVVFLAALDTALGTDFGLSQTPGFDQTGLFPIYVTGPLGRTFNYADAHDGIIRAPQMFWLARRFHRPLFAAYEQAVAAPHPLDLLWYEPTANTAFSRQPLDYYFRHADVVLLRSRWDDRDALFVGFKGGDNRANHSHLDLGTFVLDALGVRWADDLGPDDYNLPGYFDFGRRRWTYYRLRAEGHNTLVINPGAGPDQSPSAAAPIVRYVSHPNGAFTIADLTAAYRPQADHVLRGICLLGRKRLLVQDEIDAPKPADVWWFLHTRASITVGPDESAAILSQADERLWARILSPAHAGFVVRPAEPVPGTPNPPGQADNRNTRTLAVHLAHVTDTRLVVLLVPLRPNAPPPSNLPRVVALNQWQ